MEVHATARRQILLRAGRVVTTRSEPRKLFGAEHLPTAHGLAGGDVDDRDHDPVGMVRCSQVGELLEPADERLRIAHADADVDATEERITVEAPTRRRQTGNAGARASPPGRRRRSVEADLPDRGSRPIHVWVQLPATPQRVDEDPCLAGEDELAQVDVPVARTRPADVLARYDRLTRQDERVDVAVPEVADVGVAAHAVRRGEEHGPALDCVHAMCPPGRRPTLRPVVADGDVHALVVNGAALGVWTGVEKRAPDRVLSVARADRPAAVRVVVRLR